MSITQYCVTLEEGEEVKVVLDLNHYLWYDPGSPRTYFRGQESPFWRRVDVLFTPEGYPESLEELNSGRVPKRSSLKPTEGQTMFTVGYDPIRRRRGKLLKVMGEVDKVEIERAI